MAPSTSSSGAPGPENSATDVVFVQYPTDGPLGRKHLQVKEVSEHLSRRKRAEKINRLRNLTYRPKLIETQPPGESQYDVPDKGKRSDADQPGHQKILGDNSGGLFYKINSGFKISNPSNLWNSGWAAVAAACMAFPVKANHQEMDLVQYTLNLPTLKDGVPNDAPIIFHRESLIRVICKTPGLFYGMLLFSAIHRDVCQGPDLSIMTMSYRSRALHFLKEAIKNPEDRFSLESYVMVGLMANIESVVGAQDLLHNHCRALQHIYPELGRAEGLVKNPDFDFVSCCAMLLFRIGYVGSFDILVQEDKILGPQYLMDVRDSVRGLLSFVSRFLDHGKPKSTRTGVIKFCKQSPWLRRVLIPDHMKEWPDNVGTSRPLDRQRANDLFILFSICHLVNKYSSEEAIKKLIRLKQVLRVGQPNVVLSKHAITWILIGALGLDPLDKWDVVDMVHAMARFSLASQDLIFECHLATLITSNLNVNEVFDNTVRENLEDEGGEVLQKLGGDPTTIRMSRSEREALDYPIRGVLHAVQVDDIY